MRDGLAGLSTTISFFFFSNAPATTDLYTLSLHDALPIYRRPGAGPAAVAGVGRRGPGALPAGPVERRPLPDEARGVPGGGTAGRSLGGRSEEHTSELQSRPHLVCRLLLEKKKCGTDWPACRPQSHSFSFLMLRPPPTSTLFPYTTLFRSTDVRARDLPRWLALADVGLALYRPGLSNVARFPTKLGEYLAAGLPVVLSAGDRKSTRLNSSHVRISYAVFCLKKKNAGRTGRPVDHNLILFLF